MPSAISFSAEAFLKVGMNMLGRRPQKDGDFTFDDRDHFIKNFGTTPLIVSIAYELMRDHTDMNKKTKPYQILWGLLTLKLYKTEKVLCDHVSNPKPPTPKTLREWAWKVIGWLADLEPYVIDALWEDRHEGVPPGEKSICVNGTDCPTQEPSPFSSRNFSFKFGAAGYRYQVTTSRNGDIIDIDGPHRPGHKWGSEKRIFERGVMTYLDDNEKCEGDKYYRCMLGDTFPGYDTEEERAFAARFRARHESLNGRLKRFSVLTDKFRHKPAFEKHSQAFRAIAVICQLEIETSSPLFTL